MCFSPEVSFASAAVLVPVGMVCLWTAARRVPRLWPLAIVPAVFGLQQACEGFVWLGLGYGDGRLSAIAARAYLFFALAFWPFWFSVAAAVMEPHPDRRRVLTVWAVLSTGWFWVAYLPLSASTVGMTVCVRHHSVHYDCADDTICEPVARWALRVLYVLTATAPLLVSSWRRVLLLPAVLGVGSALVAVAAYDHAFTSVWCLFAAVLSASLLRTIATATRLTPPPPAGQ